MIDPILFIPYFIKRTALSFGYVITLIIIRKILIVKYNIECKNKSSKSPSANLPTGPT